MEGVMVVLLFIALALGLASGHPVAFVLGGLAVIFGMIGWGPESLTIFTNNINSVMGNFTLVAIAMFTFMANLLSGSRIAEGLFESIRYLLGRIPGGVAFAIIVVSTILAATTGIVGASIVTMGVLGLPVLLRYGYDKKLSTGVIAAGGTLGILIPPSIMLVVMGAQAQVSVGDLFKASLIPGLLLAFLYAVYVLFITWRNPELGPPMTKEELAAVPMSERIKGSLVNLIPPVLLIAAVLGTIYTGIATPTEASGVGAFVALLMTIGYRKFNFKMLSEAVYETAKTTAMVLVIMIGATAFASIFMALRGDKYFQELFNAIGLGQWGVFTIMMIFIFIMGMFLDWVAIVMIAFPIFFPLLQQYDLNMVWIVITISVMLQSSFLTPPFGHALFYMKAVAGERVSMIEIYKGVIPFIVIILVVVTIISVFPEIVLWLPRVFPN
jgi:tripartite ATP-independent transporter DctM subunit